MKAQPCCSYNFDLCTPVITNSTHTMRKRLKYLFSLYHTVVAVTVTSVIASLPSPLNLQLHLHSPSSVHSLKRGRRVVNELFWKADSERYNIYSGKLVLKFFFQNISHVLKSLFILKILL